MITFDFKDIGDGYLTVIADDYPVALLQEYPSVNLWIVTSIARPVEDMRACLCSDSMHSYLCCLAAESQWGRK